MPHVNVELISRTASAAPYSNGAAWTAGTQPTGPVAPVRAFSVISVLLLVSVVLVLPLATG